MSTYQSETTTAQQPLRVSHWPIKVIGGIAALMFAWFAFLSFYDRQPLPGWGFVLLVLLGIGSAAIFGPSAFDQEQITHRNTFGVYQIRWPAIKEIQFDATGYGYVFQGEGKRLVLPGRSLWRGKDKPAIERLIAAKQAVYHFAMRQTPGAAYKLSKNVKVGRRSSV
jgi:hypothetical protein